MHASDIHVHLYIAGTMRMFFPFIGHLCVGCTCLYFLLVLLKKLKFESYDYELSNLKLYKSR